MSNRKVVVTGAFGFIGVYLVDELLRQGFAVIATGHREAAAKYYSELGVPYCHLDIAAEDDFANLPAEGVEAVVHLVGLLPANVQDCRPHDYIRTNVLGTLNVLEYCRRHGVPKVIGTTSYADVQNAWTASPPVKDDALRNFRLTGDHAMYVISKNAATDSILHYDAALGLHGAVFRLPPVYGYGPHLVIYVDGKRYKSGFQIFLEKASAGQPIEIWGNRAAVRDVVYVKDVVQAFVKAIRNDTARGVYNITSGKGVTLEEQATAMIEAFSPPDAPSELIYRPEKENNIQSYVFDIAKAHRDFGYQPEYGFLEMLVDYKREQQSGRYDRFIESRSKS